MPAVLEKQYGIYCGWSKIREVKNDERCDQKNREVK